MYMCTGQRPSGGTGIIYLVVFNAVQVEHGETSGSSEETLGLSEALKQWGMQKWAW